MRSCTLLLGSGLCANCGQYGITGRLLLVGRALETDASPIQYETRLCTRCLREFSRYLQVQIQDTEALETKQLRRLSERGKKGPC